MDDFLVIVKPVSFLLFFSSDHKHPRSFISERAGLSSGPQRHRSCFHHFFACHSRQIGRHRTREGRAGCCKTEKGLIIHWLAPTCNLITGRSRDPGEDFSVQGNFFGMSFSLMLMFPSGSPAVMDRWEEVPGRLGLTQFKIMAAAARH